VPAALRRRHRAARAGRPDGRRSAAQRRTQWAPAGGDRELSRELGSDLLAVPFARELTSRLETPRERLQRLEQLADETRGNAERRLHAVEARGEHRDAAKRRLCADAQGTRRALPGQRVEAYGDAWARQSLARPGLPDRERAFGAQLRDVGYQAFDQ